MGQIGEGGHCQTLGPGLGSEHRVLEGKRKIRSQSKAQIGKQGSGPVCGARPLGRGAAAGASPWVAGSIGNRLGGYVQR